MGDWGDGGGGGTWTWLGAREWGRDVLVSEATLDSPTKTF